ncbi:MAG TPA: PilZ domain-containing protein [Terriglobales bacterium]|nr:PilZ domain-containing protein [Terriglobales bacterium]
MTMSVPTGRSEKRIARAAAVEICLQDEPMLKEGASTENVSAHGARVLMKRQLRPGQQVLVTCPQEGVRSPARIVYCHNLGGPTFAVGLELSGRVDWARPY